MTTMLYYAMLAMPVAMDACTNASSAMELLQALNDKSVQCISVAFGGRYNLSSVMSGGAAITVDRNLTLAGHRVANECQPSKGCNVCEKCCQSYVGDCNDCVEQNKCEMPKSAVINYTGSFGARVVSITKGAHVWMSNLEIIGGKALLRPLSQAARVS